MDKNLGIFDHLNKTFGEFWNKKTPSGKSEEKSQGTGGDAANLDGVDKQEVTYWSLLNETRNKKGERRRSSSRDESETIIRSGERKLKMGNQESLNGIVPKEESEQLQQYIPLSDKGGSSSVKNSSANEYAVRDKENRVIDPDCDVNETRRTGEKRISRIGENKTRTVKNSGQKSAIIYSREEYVDSKKGEDTEKRLSSSEEVKNDPVGKIKISESRSTVADKAGDTAEELGSSKKPESAFTEDTKNKESRRDMDPVKKAESSDVNSKSQKNNCSTKDEKTETSVNFKTGGSSEVSERVSLESEEIRKFLKNIGNVIKSSEEITDEKVKIEEKPETIVNIIDSTETAKIELPPAPVPERSVSCIENVENKNKNNAESPKVVNSHKTVGSCGNQEKAKVKTDIKTESPTEPEKLPLKVEGEPLKNSKLENPSKILASISAGMEIRKASLSKNSNAQEPVKQVTEKLISSVVCGHIMEVSEKNPKKLGTPSNNVKGNGAQEKGNLVPTIGDVGATPAQKNTLSDKRETENLLTGKQVSVIEKDTESIDPKSQTDGKEEMTVEFTRNSASEVRKENEDKDPKKDEMLKKNDQNHEISGNIHEGIKTVDCKLDTDLENLTEKFSEIVQEIGNKQEVPTVIELLNDKKIAKEPRPNEITAEINLSKCLVSKQDQFLLKHTATKDAAIDVDKKLNTNISASRTAFDGTKLTETTSKMNNCDDEEMGKSQTVRSDPLRGIDREETADAPRRNGTDVRNVDSEKILGKLNSFEEKERAANCINHQMADKDLVKLSEQEKAPTVLKINSSNCDNENIILPREPTLDAKQSSISADKLNPSNDKQKLEKTFGIKENKILEADKNEVQKVQMTSMANDQRQKLTRSEFQNLNGEKNILKNSGNMTSVSKNSDKVIVETELKQLPEPELVGEKEVSVSSVPDDIVNKKSEELLLANSVKNEAIPRTVAEKNKITVTNENEVAVSKLADGDADKIVKNDDKKVEDPEIDELKRLLLDKLKLANSAPITTTDIKDSKKLAIVHEEDSESRCSGKTSTVTDQKTSNVSSSQDISNTEVKKEANIETIKSKTDVSSHELNIITEEERQKGTQSSLSNRSSVDLDSRAMSPFSDAGSGTATPKRRRSVKSRRPSSGNKSSSESSSRRDSRGFSPFESNSRRGSRALSPLSSFSNIQEKIQALSRDSSQTEIVKKTPKIHKLDDKALIICKEPVKVGKPKEPIKITPKIDSTLQTKILKFGMPSAAKLPKKNEPMKVEKPYSVIGGFAIKDPEEQKEGVTESSKVKPHRRNKSKAPLPPGQQEKSDGGNDEGESVPSTPTANRHEVKVRKVKGKAPLPPVQNDELSKEAAKVHGDIINMTNEINQLLQDTKDLHKETKTLPTSPTAKRRSSKPSTPSSVRKLNMKETEIGAKENKNSDDNNNKVMTDKKRRSSNSDISKTADFVQKPEVKTVACELTSENQTSLLQVSTRNEISSKLDIAANESKILVASDKNVIDNQDEKKNSAETKVGDLGKVANKKESGVKKSISGNEAKGNVKNVEAEASKVQSEKNIQEKLDKVVSDAGLKIIKTENVGEEKTVEQVKHSSREVSEFKINTEHNKSPEEAVSNKSNKAVTNDTRSSKTELSDKKEITKESKKDLNSIEELTSELQTKAPKNAKNSTKEKKASDNKLIVTSTESDKNKVAKESGSKPATQNLSSKPAIDAKDNAKLPKLHSPKNITESKIPTLKPGEEKGTKISPLINRKDQNSAEDSISLASSSSRDSFETLKSSRSPSPSSYESCNEADKKKQEKDSEPQSSPEEKDSKLAVEKKVKYSSRGEIIPDDGPIKPLGLYKCILEPVKDSNTITLVPAYRPAVDPLKPKPINDSNSSPLGPEKSADVPKSEGVKQEPKSKTHTLIESIRKQLQSSELSKKPDNEPKSEDDLSLSDSLTISYGAVKRKASADITFQDNKFEKYEMHLKCYEEMFSPERTPFTPEGTPFSDFSDDSYDHYVTSDYSLDSSFNENQSSRRSSRCSSTPRRIFPQIAKPVLYEDDKAKEDSPVIFDAGLTFDLCSKRSRTPVRQLFQPQPAFSEPQTVSNSLSTKIADFLNRTDHVMEEWKRLGKSDSGDLKSCVELPSYASAGHPKSKSKSATNIMIKGLLNYSRGSSVSSVRSPSRSRYSESSDRTLSDLDELSEMAVDLTEERSTANLQAERLEAETAERIRLEQELSLIQHEKKNLQQTSERLEMELFYARADVNGLSEGEADLEDGNADAGIYKQKCERIMRELEFTRRRLQQQHEDDLEQLVGLKKQLEKKLSDAYEEVEEQRQVVGQWKRKVQKLQAEMNDLRLLLEEQSSRNNLLEKKQRKFDSEIQMLQDELRSEKNQRDRASREKEIAVAEKYSMEQNLSSVRLELELKEEKLASLTRELDDLSRGGGSEQEVTQLRKAKHDLEMKLKEQEEELDELAGQVSMLEGNKLRLEMSLESLRKDHRREMTQRDDELDEVRSNAHKKVKALESQLESEHEERTLLLREKHELERRLNEAEERGRHYRAADEDALLKLRRDLKKTKALLRDAQVMLERAKQDSPSKAALRQLKNQLEDAELARASAVKAKQSLESELNEVSGQLEEALRAKGDAENRYQAAQRDSNALRTQVDENEEELAELLKKYRSTVQQLSAEQLANQETAGALAEAEAERASLRDQLAELTAKLEASSLIDPASGLAQKRLEIRIKELESRLELEQTTRGRLEVQIARLKENVERLTEECVQARTKEQAASDLTRKLQRTLRETKEDLAQLQAKEQEFNHKKKDLEKRLETAEQEAMSARTDLRLAVKRIEDLQNAISGEIGSDSERSDSEVDSDSGDDSLISQLPSGLSSARTSCTPDVTPR